VAGLTISTRGLDEVQEVSADGTTVTVQAGVPLDALRQILLAHGCWLPLDPPGRSDRTIGSVLATATAGPLRAGFGPIRDQVSALTVVRADGHVVRLTREADGDPAMRLHLGGFGGFGVITEATLTLQPVAPADTTWVTMGPRDRLTAAARELSDQQQRAAAAELMSPALASEGEWLLAVRLLGDRWVVEAEGARLQALGHLHWHELPRERRMLLWNGSSRGISTVPVTLRLGVLPEGIDEAIDMVIAHLGEGMLSAGALAGSIRWSGHADAVTLRALRARFAAREIPLTLERAPWALRRAVGHFGVYREGIGGPIERLRERHDPANILVTGILGESAG
jgi:FAD/FMN-containing dehydrogenase